LTEQPAGSKLLLVGIWRRLRKELFLEDPRGRSLILPVILLFGIAVLFCISLPPSLHSYYSYPDLERRYDKWLTDPGNLDYFMRDRDLYAYAGWKYVNGISPEQINFEHPPFAKYLIGLSWIAFGNPNIIGAGLGLASLFVFYELSRKLLRQSLLALLPVYLLSLDKLFLEFSSDSMLDIYLVFFLILSTLLLIGMKTDAEVIGGAISYGLACASKLIGLYAFPAVIVYLVLKRRNGALRYLTEFVLTFALTYTATYICFFLSGHGLQDFLELQWRMFTFQSELRYDRPFSPGRPLLTLLTGIIGPETRYVIHVDIVAQEAKTTMIEHGLAISDQFNPLTWPLCFSGAILSSYEAIKARKHELLHLCMLFFSILIPINIGQSFVWYLLPLLPIGFLLLTNVLGEISEKSKRRTFLFLLALYLIALSVWSRLAPLPQFMKL